MFEEIIVKKWPQMEMEIVSQLPEEQRFPNRINPRRNTPRRILTKVTKKEI